MICSTGWSQTVPPLPSGSVLSSTMDGLLTATPSAAVQPASRNYFQRIKQAGRYGYAELVRTRSVAAVQQRGADGRFWLSLALPKLDGPVAVETVEVRAADEANYLWRGTIPGDPTSQIVLRSRADTLFGTIRFTNKTYVLEGLEPGVSLLLGDLASDTDGEKSTEQFSGCPVDGTDSPLPGDPDHKLPATGLEKSSTCQSDVFRIQVLHTSAAQQTGNMSQLAQASVDQLNDMFLRSDVSLEAELVAVELFSQFVENPTNGILSDVGRLTGGSTSLTNFVNNRMGVNGADLTIVFADEVYGGDFGVVAGIAPPNRVSIVVAPRSTSEMTFAHEIGHLLGGRHEESTAWQSPSADSDTTTFITFGPLNIDNTTSIGHAHIDFNFNSISRDEARVTAMFSNPEYDGPEMYYLGQWDVDYLPLFSTTTIGTFNGYSVGTVGIRDNAAVFNNNASAVVGLNPQCDFYAYANANPDFGAPFDNYSATANSVGCVSGTPTYAWYTSTNGFTYTYAGSGSSLSGTLTDITGTFRIRLNATCDNNDGNFGNDPTSIAYDNIYVEEGGCQFCRSVASPTDSPPGSLDGTTEPVLDAWPNPGLHGRIHLLFRSPDANAAPAQVTLQDQHGRTVRTYILTTGVAHPIDTNDLPRGIYVARAIQGDHSVTRKIVIAQ